MSELKITDSLHEVRFPGEEEADRGARDELLRAEIQLRESIEKVAALRRDLPLGGAVKQDYLFEEVASSATRSESPLRLSELFQPGKNSLILYSFMFGPNSDPCPMCNSFLDGLDGYAPHITERVNLAIVAKSSPGRIAEWSRSRGWNHLKLLSSEKNSYNTDYFAETPQGNQIPACNVFTKTPDGIRHFYAAELLYVPVPGHPRHMDLLWPIWNFFDLTPEGRGTDWMPRLSY